MNLAARLDEFERLARAATAGPWPKECERLVHFREFLRRTGAQRPDEDVAHIAACSPERIVALVTVVRRAMELDELADDEDLHAALAALEKAP